MQVKIKKMDQKMFHEDITITLHELSTQSVTVDLNYNQHFKL